MMSDGYNGWKNWDSWETALILENTESTYRWILEWNKNFRRKMKKGVFNQAKAESVVEKYIIPVARGKGMASRFSGFTFDPDIDRKKVDKAEIVNWILEQGE